MDFFDRQDLARRQTGRLIALFVVAVILIVAAVNAAAYGILRVGGAYVRVKRETPARFYTDRHRGEPIAPINSLRLYQRADIYVATSLVTLAIIACGTAYKVAMLSGGGSVVARSMGGRPIQPGSTQPEEVTLRNVVEEMSIASGVPVPQVYVMDDEDGINAFAAGFGTDDAVIAVTRGCLTRLSRDELQGVVAHEFSHILNGDMRLNLRLVGILHGILVIGLFGYGMLRSLEWVRVDGRSSRRAGKDNGLQVVLLIALAGVTLLVIGYVGVFFGKLIQAAVSRQREFLADASAVQFTRNPRGLAGALAKIAQLSDGSRVRSAAAVGAAHMFFSNITRARFVNLLATHPPIDQRIRAIDPTFDLAATPLARPLQTSASSVEPRPGTLDATTPGFATSHPTARLSATSVTETVGRPTPRSARFATDLLGALPDPLRRATSEPFSARAVALAILVSDEPEPRGRQLQIVQSQLDAPTFNEMMRLLRYIEHLPDEADLPMLDLALPALRQMSEDQRRQFRSVARALIEADGRVTVLEYAIFRVIRNQLPSLDASRRPRPVQHYAIRPLLGEISTVLSALAYRDGTSDSAASDAFRRGSAELDGSAEPLAPATDRSLAALDGALNRLAESAPGIKRRVVQAAAQVVAADGVVESDEAALLRAVCAALDVPLPPVT